MLAVLVCAVATSCASDATPAATGTTIVATTTAPTTATTPTTSAFTTLPLPSLPADFDAAVQAVCNSAQDQVFTVADRLGYWDHPLDAPARIEYFGDRAAVVDWMLAAFAAVTAPTDRATDWATAVDHLRDWGDGQRGQAPEDGGPSLFREFFDNRGVCGDLFDMN